MTTTPRPGPPQLPVGWHPDPWTDGDLYRYWDGNAWTSRTKRAPRRKQRRRVVFPLAFASFLLVAVVTAVMMTRGNACKVSIGGASVEFFSCQEVEARQSQMQEQADSAKEQAKAQATNAPAAAVSVAGLWNPEQGGFGWQIEQYGSQLVVRQVTQYGVTAVAQGSLAGRTADLSYQAVDGSTGGCGLQFVSGSTLVAACRNYVTNAEFSTTFHR